MINIALLNDQPTLNNYYSITSVQYIPGETVKINFQILDVDAKIRFIPPSAATMNVTFKKSDGTDLVKAATKLFDPDDRSIWQVSLDATESPLIIGNNFLVTLDVNGDATEIEQGIGENMLTKNLFEGDC